MIETSVCVGMMETFFLSTFKLWLGKLVYEGCNSLVNVWETLKTALSINFTLRKTH